MFRRIVIGLGVCVLLVGLSSCVQQGRRPVQPPPRSSQPPEPPMLEHEVLYSGETLALIANWYTGKSQNWTIIRDANPGLRPERMNIGQRILIPGNLLIRREPLPRKLIGVRSSKPTDTSASGTDSTGDSSNPAVNEVGSEQAGGEPNSVDSFDKELERAMAESEKNAATPPPVVDVPPPPPPVAPPPAVSTGAPATGATGGGDAEREKLLDELLTQ